MVWYSVVFLRGVEFLNCVVVRVWWFGCGGLGVVGWFLE